uniref:INCENP_ARK-bind domain-containing protein n=1 Tax=Strongyloides venezuelensis TaxID=75913 RepID=A0A0K0FP78_STRVS
MDSQDSKRTVASNSHSNCSSRSSSRGSDQGDGKKKKLEKEEERRRMMADSEKRSLDSSSNSFFESVITNLFLKLEEKMTDGFRGMEARMDQLEQHLADLEGKFDSGCGAAIPWKKAKKADKEESEIWDADFNGKLVKIKDLPLDVVSAMVDEKCRYMKDEWISRKISWDYSTAQHVAVSRRYNVPTWDIT